MALNKKGMFFTLLVLVLISLFFISYTLYTEFNEAHSTRKRVETMNSFLFSTEKDLDRQLYIAGFRIIFLLENRIVQTGQYVSSPERLFKEAFFNGSLYGEPQELMLGATFGNIYDAINEKAQKINAHVTLTNATATISQNDPWNIEVTLTSQLYFADENALASWNKTHTATAHIPISLFEDPLYLVSTNGLVTNKINKTVFQPFVQGSTVTNLSAHALGSYYIASTLAPSFLDRLQGIATANSNGIESLVNLQRLSSQGISVQDKTVVDYIYFSTQNPTPRCTVPGMPSWFKLDQNHLALYNSTAIAQCRVL